MRETLAFIVIAFLSSLPVSLPVLIGGGIALAVIILIAALLLFRSSGKGKGTKPGTSQGAMGWQQQGQQNAAGQSGWNQQGVGNQADNQWAQPQGAAGWNAQQQDPNAWGAQQQQAAWGMQNQQQGANAWGAQQQPGADSWAAQNPAQPSANQWGQPASPAANQWGQPASSQSPLASPQSASAWGASGTPAPGSNQASGQGWNSPLSPQGQPAAQADQWGQSPQQMQQPGAASWGTPASAGSAVPQQPSGAFGGNTASPSWAQSPQPVQPSQQPDQWGQPAAQPAQPQQPGNIWGMQGQSQQAQPAAPTAYGGNPPANQWGQPSPVAQPVDQWGQPAAQQPVQQNWGQPAQSGNLGTPAWQQPNQGGPGTPAGMFEADKTMLRPNPGAQGSVGMVRVEEGKEPGKVYEVRKDSLSIGRSRESDIFLEDLAVSRLHASIVNMGNGSYALKDEGSANGTKVNGQMVNKYQTYPLQEGDKIQLGQTVLVFTRR